MKYGFLLAAFLLGFSNSFAQFHIKEAIGSINDLKLPESKAPIYEDDKYIVRRTCAGEFGGTVWFKSKQTGVERSFMSTCAVSVNRVGTSYIVTSSLAHLSGYSRVDEVANPEELEAFVYTASRVKKGKLVVRYHGDDQSTSLKGTVKLADSGGIYTLGSFVSNGKLYHIQANHKNTYLSTIKDGKFIMLNLISSEPLWDYSIPFTVNGRLVIPFEGKVKGYIEVEGDAITVKSPKVQ